MLPKKNKLSAKDFPKVYKNGVKSKGIYGMLISLPSSESEPKFGFVVSKKIGNAVKRHKMTRRLRSLSIDLSKKYEVKNRSFQYVAFQFPENFSDLSDEFEKHLRTLIHKNG